MADEYSNAYQYTGGISKDYGENRYQEQHLEHYPGGVWGPETRLQRKKYDRMTKDVNAKRGLYESTASAYGAESLDPRFYTRQMSDISNLRQEGHAFLKQPAADCADTYLEYARRRHEFLVKEPYAYQNIDQRVKHETYAINNYNLAENFRDRLSLHEREDPVSIPSAAAAPSSASSGSRGRSRARSRPSISSIGGPLRSRSRFDLHDRPGSSNVSGSDLHTMGPPRTRHESLSNRSLFSSSTPGISDLDASPSVPPSRAPGRFRRIGNASSSVSDSRVSSGGTSSGFQFTMPPLRSSTGRGRSHIRSPERDPGSSILDSDTPIRRSRFETHRSTSSSRPPQPLDEGSRGRLASRFNTTDARRRSPSSRVSSTFGSSYRSRSPRPNRSSSTFGSDFRSRSPSRPRTSTALGGSSFTDREGASRAPTLRSRNSSIFDDDAVRRRSLSRPRAPSSRGPSSTYSIGDSRRRSPSLGPRPSTYGSYYRPSTYGSDNRSRSQIRSRSRSGARYPSYYD